MHVAAAVVKNEELVFVARRARHKAEAGKWEFPGGKVEAGETAEAALIREIDEEFGVSIKVLGPLHRAITVVGSLAVDLDAYLCLFDGDEPKLSSDHDEIRWVKITELKGYEFAKPDMPVIQKLLESECPNGR